MPKKEQKPHLIKLGKFVRNSIEQSGLTIAQFADKAGFTSSSTVYQIVKATVEITYPTAKKISDGLRLHANVKVSADDLMAMIEAEPQPSNKVEVLTGTNTKRAPEILAASAVLWHLQRIPASERQQIWPDVLKLLQSDVAESQQIDFDVAIGRRPSIDVLISLINSKADQHGIGTIRAFAQWMLGESQSDFRLRLIVKGLQTIFAAKRLPYQDDPEYKTTIGHLASTLDFSSDTALLTYCNLAPQPSPESLKNSVDISE